MKKQIKKLEKNFVIILTKISIKLSSKYLFLRSQKHKLNLKNPKDFNEKLMWLKIYNYNKNYLVWQCSDKYKVREYALSKGVNERNLPTILSTYSDAMEIDFSQLPNKFALKCSHGSGFNIICQDKTKIDENKVKKQLNKWLKTKYGYSTAEPHYTHVKPIIICEEFIENFEDEYPYDYKIYCFSGVPKIILVCSERARKLRLNFFDLDWHEVPFGKETYRSDKKIERPTKLEDMLDIATKVSSDFPFVRVDFYQYKNEAILGEMTFTPTACCSSHYSGEGLLKLAEYMPELKSDSK